MPVIVNEFSIHVAVNSSNESPGGQSNPSPRPEAVIQGIKELARLIKEKNER